MKKTILAMLLIFALALSLTACNGKDNGGDNSTPGTSGSSAPDNSTSSAASVTSGTNTPAPPKVTGYDEEKKKEVDTMIDYYSNEFYHAEIDKIIGEVFAEYGEFINPNILPEAVRTAIYANKTTIGTYTRYIFDLPESTITKVNDFLASKGKEPLKISTTSESHYKGEITIAVIGASLVYESNFSDYKSILIDLGVAFARAYSGTNDHTGDFSMAFFNDYYVLYEE